MTLFEKIYWTLLVINIVLAIISLFEEIDLGNIDIDVEWLRGFLELQVIFNGWFMGEFKKGEWEDGACKECCWFYDSKFETKEK